MQLNSGDLPATASEQLFAAIANDLRDKGYSINFNALPPGLADRLLQQVHAIPPGQLTPAGIGRTQDQTVNRRVRKDSICWITEELPAGRQWLEWSGELQRFLNQQLFLGLFSFESHFAHYSEGAFYRRHLDVFKGEDNRVLSLVVYLNPGWLPKDGGELVIYPEKGEQEGVPVTPEQGTLALFLSEEFEHEVLPAKRDRFSIAGWFRVNSSGASRVDPPA